MADVVLDARVTALEESGGANEQNGKSEQTVFLTLGSICEDVPDISPFNYRSGAVNSDMVNLKFHFI